MLAARLITTGRNNPPFHGSNAGVTVKLSRQSLSGKMVLRNVRIKCARIEINRMATDGPHNGNAPLEEFMAEVLDLPDASADVIVLNGFNNAARHGFHIAASHPTVSMQ